MTDKEYDEFLQRYNDFKQHEEEAYNNEDISKNIAIAFQFGLAMGFAKKCDKCDDCISRQVAIDAFEKFIHELGIEDEPYNYGEIVLSAKNVPPVIPQSKKGHWIPIVVRGQNSYCCSECSSECCYTPTAFCPDCGCEMVESEGKNETDN